jgi:acetyltransferase-like isoleucine patch superfamily enzyme
MSFYTEEELSLLGIKYGKNVLISRYCRLYHPESITIGNYVRIDDFCILSSLKPMIIDDHVHISAGVYIYGSAGIHIHSYSNISASVKIFTETDTFDGTCLIGPTVPIECRKVKSLSMTIEKHTVIGSNSVVMPCKLGEGVAIGANSFVNKDCDPWTIYAGSPIRKIKERSKDLLQL